MDKVVPCFSDHAGRLQQGLVLAVAPGHCNKQSMRSAYTNDFNAKTL